nr:zinc finger, CCHC-type [Tanacetum cinerariifolium]
AVVRLSNPKRKILGEKGIDCIFVGYAEHSTAYRPKDVIPNLEESQKDDHSDDVPSETPEPHREEDPRTYDEAMQSRDAAFWKEAIDDEIGFRQKEGIDYFDTYAPVARITTIRLLLALVVVHNLVIYQMDVKTTFLNGDLDEEVYKKQPKGFVMPGNEHTVCKLVKSLYGLKQAPKQWHQKFNEVVQSSGFLLNQSDKCVYSKFDSPGIIHETTAPYTPQQNGMAEKNRALKEMVNFMLSYSSLSEGFRGEAMLTTCYLLNSVPNKR